MAERIKGITIEFRGDTSELDKALKKVDSESKDVNKSLRDVDKALKFNPNNVELLAQKQQMLKTKVTQTKEKLDVLRQAQAKLDDDPAVDKTSREYMDLRRKIIETESQLKHFETEAKKLNNIKLQAFGKQISDVGDKMKNIGTGMSKYVTAPIVGAAGASAKAWQEVDEGLDIVTQKTGASGKALEGMQQSVKNLTQQIPTDFATAGAAVGEVNTRFGVTGEELEKLSGKFIKFAQLNETDVSSSIDQVQKAMEAFGVPASEAGGMLDLLNKVGQDTGISMDTLAQSLVTNAPQLQAMGLTANQAATFLGQLEVSGIDSSKALSGLSKAIVNGAKQGKALPEVMDEIQTSIVGAKSETDAMNAASEIFGAKAGPAIATAARSGALDFQSLTSSVTDAEGSLESTFNETLDPADKFKTSLNSLKLTGYEIADTMFQYLNPALEKLSGWLQDLSEKWNQLSPGTQKAILVIGGILAVIGPLLVILGTLASSIGSIITLVTTIGPVMAGLAGPIGIVIGIIGALIAIGVLLYKNWDKIKNFAGKVKDHIVAKFTALKIAVKVIFEKIKEAMLTPIRKAVDTIKNLIKKIKDFFKFKVSLPKIKLPHFNIEPPGWQLGDLLHGEIPSLGIKWYKQGGIFNSPSVIGVGEAGPEAVLPIEKLQAMMAAMADSIVNGIGTSMALQAAGAGGDITIPIYLYPSGPKMGEETVKMYDLYKGRLG